MHRAVLPLLFGALLLVGCPQEKDPVVKVDSTDVGEPTPDVATDVTDTVTPDSAPAVDPDPPATTDVAREVRYYAFTG